MPVLEVIEQAPRRGDDHVYASPKRLHLRTHSHAAVDGRGLDPRMARQRSQIFQELQSQFPGGCQDQGPRGAPRQIHEPVQNGEQEGGGLAASRGGAGEKISPLEGRRDRVRLNGGRGSEPQIVDALQESRVQFDGRERQGYSYCGASADRPERPTREAGAEFWGECCPRAEEPA